MISSEPLATRTRTRHDRHDRSRARALLQSLSYQVEKTFRQRGRLRGYLWLTVNMQGHREWFETECLADPRKIDDAVALVALRAELRDDFARDLIILYGVAFPAAATVIIRQSILHLNGEEAQQEVVCLEAHDGDVHLRAQREVHNGRLTALAAIEEATGCFALLC